MAFNNEFSNSISLTNNLKMKKELINNYRENFLNSNNSGVIKDISINRSDFEDLLWEFESTISQLLQAIKTLEVENSNMKEIIYGNKESQKDSLQKGVSQNSHLNFNYQLENEMTNYNFQSPTNAQINFEKNKVEEISFSPDTNREDEEVEYKNKNLESILGNNSLSYNYDYANINRNFETNFNNKLDFNTISHSQFAPSQHILSALNLNFDYSNIKQFNELFSTKSTIPNDSHQGQTQYSHYTSNLPHDKEKLNYLSKEDNIKQKDFTFENKEEDKAVKEISPTEQSIQNMVKQEDVYEKPVLQVNNFNLKAKSKMAYKFEVTTESEPEKEELKVNDLESVKNNQVKGKEANSNSNKVIVNSSHKNNADTILTNEYLSEPNIRQGLRQKILQNKLSGQTTLQNSPKRQSKNNTIEVYKPNYNYYNERIDTESSIPSINSKQNAFNNRMSEMERDIIVNNILKMINRVENSKPLLAGKYAKGSYGNFLQKLTGGELNYDEVESDLKSIAEENEKRAKKKKSMDQVTGKNRLTYNHSAKNLKPPEYEIGNEYRSKSSKKSKNSSKGLNNSTYNSEYIEPVNFETFLRDSKKPVIKNGTKKNNNLHFNNRSRAGSKDRRDRDHQNNSIYNKPRQFL